MERFSILVGMVPPIFGRMVVYIYETKSWYQLGRRIVQSFKVHPAWLHQFTGARKILHTCSNRFSQLISAGESILL
jgi:hypothetical protein